MLIKGFVVVLTGLLLSACGGSAGGIGVDTDDTDTDVTSTIDDLNGTWVSSCADSTVLTYIILEDSFTAHTDTYDDTSCLEDISSVAEIARTYTSVGTVTSSTGLDVIHITLFDGSEGLSLYIYIDDDMLYFGQLIADVTQAHSI